MTTCTWFPRRHAGRRVLATVLTVGIGVATPAVSVTATAGRASADTISDKRAQAAQLAAQIQKLGQQEDAFSERYDQATMELQTAQQGVAKANQQLAADQQAETAARASLTNEAVNAYINGGDQATQATRDIQPLANADESLVRDEYVGDLTSTQNEVVQQYHLASMKTSDDRSQLQSALSTAQHQQSALAQDRQQVQATATQLQSTLNSVNGQIATLVAQAQQAAEAAAAKQAQERLAAQQAAAAAAARAAAATSGLAGGGSPAVQIVATGSLQARAVAYAESRVGDPYVWGAAGPSSFDCSGLVMWAYAQAGYSLPHFSGSQYGDTIHIPMSDLEPGDLVFPSDPGEHVAMYIGGGRIVQAPYTGADVQIVPLSSFFVYASRVP